MAVGRQEEPGWVWGWGWGLLGLAWAWADNDGGLEPLQASPPQGPATSTWASRNSFPCQP
jgi:hypothetical protein